MSRDKDAKDSSRQKHDGLRQPQRKDSLSSVLSWAALQGKITPSKPPTSSSPSTPTPSPSTSTHHHPPGNGSRPRRHSHSTSSDSKTKTPMTPDTKPSPGTSKAGKSSSSEKVNKDAPDNQDGKQQHAAPSRPQSAGDKPRSPLPPMPKSILRISSPDGYRRPSQFGTPATATAATSAAATTGEPTSAGLPPSPATPTFETVLSTPDSPPLTSSSTTSPTSSPTHHRPLSPITRPMSPGTTVRFAKATVHRVEVGPGRRFMPVKRKSKSTLTYISPLDPVAQKGAPKNMLQSPTKLRRHQENQAAMGRYWLRTEEEEAQWRAEAERRAVEEAERYRNEPASPPPRLAGGVVVEGEGVKGDGEKGDGEKGDGAKGDEEAVRKVGGEEIDKLPLLDGGGGGGSPPGGLDKVEEETVEGSEEDDDSDDEESGARCDVEDDTASVTSKGSRGSINLRPSVSIVALRAARAAAASAAQAGNSKPAEIKSFSERLAEKQAADERRSRPGSPTIPTKPDGESSKSARSSSSSLAKEKPAAVAAVAAGAVSARSSSTSTNSNSSGGNNGPSPSTGEKLIRTLSREKEKEKDKARDRPRTLTSSRSYMNLRSSASERTQKLNTSRSAGHVSSSGGGSHGSTNSHSNGDITDDHNSRNSYRHSYSHSSSSAGSGGSNGSTNSTNHLHLSGRRGRRYFDDHKQGITA